MVWPTRTKSVQARVIPVKARHQRSAALGLRTQPTQSPPRRGTKTESSSQGSEKSVMTAPPLPRFGVAVQAPSEATAPPSAEAG